MVISPLIIPVSYDGPGAAERPVNDQCPAEHQPFGDRAPAPAVRAGRAVVAQAQIVPRLHVKRGGRNLAQRLPALGITPELGPGVHVGPAGVRATYRARV